ncbi:hypothetical protein PR202_ga22748 [Eleusine coracana subsp. coracana]|uniref:Protein kinase domain-containing protein n=1 Tax=Eleusine coracana subsp. coracana TaxID=191504 RepID=A0AAV5D4T8_ELECO|nr:hypothetical protein PR202_ga22748 [Eleusine coracana subsp. coracana]
MALDWALRNDGSCQLPAEDGKSSPKPTPSACASANSYCVNATQRHGYLCHCSKGYGGNPYIEGGCITTFVAVVLACFAGVLLQRREHRKNFSKNGGDLLQEAGINTFTKGDLEKITNSYKKKIGQGHFGQVYEGTIKGTQRVAVKRPHEKGLKGAAVPVEEFRNEIIFQFRISHENLVRLVGCCLETDVPILVFEYISRGNLQEVLHGSAGGKPPCPLSLTERLDIAIGSAKALAHMHSHGEHNHVHGDVKPANILLDGDLKPKVSDFGSSKLLSVNSYARHVAADGTYIDPVYYKTGRFTVKSDVYSFGVVLLELVTRRMARHGDNILTLDFKNSCKAHGNGREMYDPEIISSDDDTESQCYMECLDMVSALAIRCLNGDDAEERPTMGEVVVELEQAKSIANREAHAMRQAEK